MDKFSQVPMATLGVQEMKEKNGGVLYHITPLSHLPKIRAIGLVPRSSNVLFHYPDRIFVIGGKKSDYILDFMADQLAMVSPNEDDTYIVLSIDVDKLADGTKFFPDLTLNGSYYTSDNIPPSAISVTRYISKTK